jgi:autotransporter-associated beta strand protein
VISGTSGVEIGLTNTSDNAGTVTLNAANTYTGGTTLDGGTLVLGNDAALGTNTLTRSNSTSSVLQAGGGTRTLANNIVWGGNGTLSGTNAFTFNGTFTSSGAAGRSITVNNTGGLTIGGNVFLAATDVAGGLTVGGSSNTTINGVITNNSGANTVASGVTKTGNGTLTLTNANTYTGGTTISGGTLLVNNTTGSGTGSGNVTVGNVGGSTPGILGGNGTISGTVTVNNSSTLSPGGTTAVGNGIAVLNTGALTLTASSTYLVDLNGGSGPTGTGAGTLYDQTQVTGTITLAGNLAATIGTALSLNDKFFIALNDSSDAVTGTFANAPANVFTSGSYTFLVNYADTGDGDLVNLNDISLTVTAVPEPSTWIGGGLALLAVGWTQRRRRFLRKSPVIS